MTASVFSEIKYWYALYLKPRQEFKANTQIESLNIEVYLPTITRTKQWSDRKKKIVEPLFRGYIFVHSDERERMYALQQDSVVRTVSFNGKPAVIPDWEIENLRRLLSESPDVFVSDKIEIGSKVKIVGGPFTDVVGIVSGSQENKWLAVSIELLNRSVMVRLPNDSVVKFIDPS
jgi:transcription antitermination factor NusG